MLEVLHGRTVAIRPAGANYRVTSGQENADLRVYYVLLQPDERRGRFH
jgi:hypothetical protein